MKPQKLVKRSRARGAALPEAVILFPVLITLYGAIMLNGKAHLSSLTAQQAARRELYRLCAAPLRAGEKDIVQIGREYKNLDGSPLRSANKQFPYKALDMAPTISPKSFIDAFEPTDPSTTNPKASYYAREVNRRLNYDPSGVSDDHFYKVFTAPIGFDSIQFATFSQTGAYFLTGDKEAKGFAAQICQGKASTSNVNDVNDDSFLWNRIEPYAVDVVLSKLDPGQTR